MYIENNTSTSFGYIHNTAKKQWRYKLIVFTNSDVIFILGWPVRGQGWELNFSFSPVIKNVGTNILSCHCIKTEKNENYIRVLL